MLVHCGRSASLRETSPPVCIRFGRSFLCFNYLGICDSLDRLRRTQCRIGTLSPLVVHSSILWAVIAVGVVLLLCSCRGFQLLSLGHEGSHLVRIPEMRRPGYPRSGLPIFTRS